MVSPRLHNSHLDLLSFQQQVPTGKAFTGEQLCQGLKGAGSRSRKAVTPGRSCPVPPRNLRCAHKQACGALCTDTPRKTNTLLRETAAGSSKHLCQHLACKQQPIQMQNQRWHISGASKRSARCELMRNAEQIKYEMKPNTSKEK